MNACVLLADGCEEIEALTVVDVLRRGGVDVTMLGTQGKQTIRGAHGIEFQADALFTQKEAGRYTLSICPGGLGCMNALRNNESVLEFLRRSASLGCFVAAICASPVVLGAAGLLKNHSYCCYPGMQEHIAEGTYLPNVHVHADGSILTGAGPASAMSFALMLLQVLVGPSIAEKVASEMLVTL